MPHVMADDTPRLPGLPAGAHGIDVGCAIIDARQSGKLLFIGKDDHGAHLTIHPGEASGIVDAHLTSAGRHTPLFGMRHEDVPRAFGKLLAFAPQAAREYAALWRTFRPTS